MAPDAEAGRRSANHLEIKYPRECSLDAPARRKKMSVSYETIECERCGYAETSLVTAGKFVWSDGSEEYWFSRQLAVCKNCECVVAMEEFPEPAVLAEARKRLGSYWRKLTRNYGVDDVGMMARSKGLAVAEKVIALQRKPVCLSCGSANVAPLVTPDDGGSDDTRIRSLGIQHPGCGGMLTIYGSGGDRAAPLEVTRIYDLHGRQIGTRPGW